MTDLDISALALWIASAVVGAWSAWHLGPAIRRRSTSLAWSCGAAVAVGLAGMTFASLVLAPAYG